MTRRHRTGFLAPALAILLALASCAWTPTHPFGALCTWPADLQIQRDQLAVLHQNFSSVDNSQPSIVTLVHVPTGAVRARCGGLSHHFDNAFFSPELRMRSTQYSPRILRSPLSPDLRWALSPAGVVELATGRLVPNPPDSWDARELLGGTAVLRERPNSDSMDTVYKAPADYCVAPRFDAPQAECRPVDGWGDGLPVSHDDGTVGWAPATPVPVRLTTGDGRVVEGIAQTDGTLIVQLRLSPPGKLFPADDTFHRPARADVLQEYDTGSSAALTAEEVLATAWYTVDAISSAGVEGTLHLASDREQTAVDYGAVMSYIFLGSAAVVDGGRTLVLGFARGYEETTTFVRVRENDDPQLLLSLDRTVPDPSDPSITYLDNTGRLPATPATILAWPDTPPGDAT